MRVFNYINIFVNIVYPKKIVQKKLRLQYFDKHACPGRHIWNGCSEFLNHKQNTYERKHATRPTHKIIFHTVVKHEHRTSTQW